MIPGCAAGAFPSIWLKVPLALRTGVRLIFSFQDFLQVTHQSPLFFLFVHGTGDPKRFSGSCSKIVESFHGFRRYSPQFGHVAMSYLLPSIKLPIGHLSIGTGVANRHNVTHRVRIGPIRHHAMTALAVFPMPPCTCIAYCHSPSGNASALMDCCFTLCTGIVFVSCLSFHWSPLPLLWLGLLASLPSAILV